MRKFLLVILLLSLIGTGTKAQSVIHFLQNHFGTVTKAPGDTILFTDSLYFSGNGVFQQNLALRAIIDSVYQGTIDSFPHTQLGLDSAHRLKAINITIHLPSTIRTGPSVIVIWPVYSGGSATLPNDTIRMGLYVYSVGIDESPLARLYLYQREGAMFINFGDAENLVQQVRLYDISGREIYSDAADRSRRISTDRMQSGIYFCEITITTGLRKVIKVQIEN